MVGAGENVEMSEQAILQLVFGEHTGNGVDNYPVGVGGADLGESMDDHAAGITGVAAV